MSVENSLIEYRRVIQVARSELRKKGKQLRVRGYVSTAFGCPFEGAVSPRKPLGVLERLLELGADEVSLGDTIGVATPKAVEKVIAPALRLAGAKRLAGHFHDTRGTALANALRAIDLGVRILDSSAGGLGGCPFAPGASGNLATEDLVYMLDGMGIHSGIDLNRLCRSSWRLAEKMNRPISSRYLSAWMTSQARRMPNHAKKGVLR